MSPTPDTPSSPPSPEPAEPTHVSTFAALAIRNYKLYFWGKVVSNIGTWMQRVAQDWLVLELTNSPFAVGVATALQFLPMLLFGMVGGLITDRYSKRALLLGTQTAMGALALALAVPTLTGVVTVWLIYAVAFGLGLATVIDNPAKQIFVNEMVPPRLVRNAVSLNSGTFQVARVVGPTVAGFLISAVGSGWAFAINALSFVATIATLAAMRPAEMYPAARPKGGRGQVREGVRYVLARPHILWLIVMMFFIGSFGFNFQVFLSAYAKNVFASGADVYGILNAALAVGSVTGALLAARRAKVRLVFLFVVSALFSAMLMILGAVGWLIPFIVLLVVTGLLTNTLSTTANATVQLSSDAVIRGRVMSLYLLVFFGGKPLGAPVVGAVTNAWGAPVAIGAVGALCLLATAGCALLVARQTGTHVFLDLHRGADRRLMLVHRHGPYSASPMVEVVTGRREPPDA